MFKGTKAHPEGEFSARVEAVGGDDNAFTTEDYTAYHQTVAKQHLKLMMEFEADRMANLEITDAALLARAPGDPRRAGMRIDNSPAARLGRGDGCGALHEQPLPHSDHRLGERDGDPRPRRCARPLQPLLHPNNAIVVVAGDVTEDEVRRSPRRPTARSPAAPIRRRACACTEPPPDAARPVTLTDPRVDPAELPPALPGALRAHRQAGRGGGAGRAGRYPRWRQRPAGSTANSWSSRASLTGIGAGYNAGQIGATAFASTARRAATPPWSSSAAAIDKVIGELIDKGVTEHELARAKERVRAAVIYSEDSPRTLANAVGAALATGDTLAESPGLAGAHRGGHRPKTCRPPPADTSTPAIR